MLLYWVESVLAREKSALIDVPLGTAREVSSQRVKVEVNPGSINGTPH